MPTQVLHLSKTNAGGDFILRLVRQLQSAGIKNYVALPTNERGDKAIAFASTGAKTIDANLNLPIRKPWELLTTFGRMRQLVEDVKPDLIHSHFFGTTMIARMALGKQHPTPRVFQVAGPLHLEHRLYRAWDAHTLGPRDYVIATCRLTESIYLQNICLPRSRVFLSYYGTEVERFHPRRNGKLRQELDLAEGAPLVGMVAWIYPPKLLLGQLRGLKGHETFIDAIALLKTRVPNVQAVIIGGQWGNRHWYENYLKVRARHVAGDTIAFLGPRDDVAELYPDLDAVAHPSLSENVGGAVESLLCRVPTVATSVGGLPDVVIDGVTGLLVPPRQPKALALALERMLCTPEEARSMAQAGECLVRNLFDVHQTALQVLNIYRRILS